MTARPYDHDADYERVGRFLVRTYGVGDRQVNWLQPRWEYMHFHPLVREIDLGAIGLWEARGDIVAVVHPEHAMGTAYFQVDPGCLDLRKEMLKHAERSLSVPAGNARRLRVHIHDRDGDFQAIASEAGYRKSDGREPMSCFTIQSRIRRVALPAGFRLKTLADDNDLRKVNRLFWRGFGHGNEPPDDGTEERRFMQSAPNYREDMNVVVEAPDGNFVSYCGMWYEPVHSIAYVEPVATDPDYRRMGLGRAAVMDGIRRSAQLGAVEAWVGSDQPFYLSLGFQPMYSTSTWERAWT
jgi:predicted N-acetyltransferase YhbS